MLRRFAIIGALVLAGCGGSGDMPTLLRDLGVSGPDLSFAKRNATDHPTLINVPNNGGAVVKNIKLYTVVWQGDEALGAQVNQFYTWMLQSPYWTQSLVEYGVDAGTAMGVLVIPSAPPPTLDDAAVSTLVQDEITAGLFPMPDSQTAFAFVLSPKTQSSLYGAQGCVVYGGYHSETKNTVNGNYVPYLVNLQCPTAPGANPFNDLTDVLSHEAAECATDPRPDADPAWVNESVALGGEVGDLCVGLEAKLGGQGLDGGANDTEYVVTRLYSQKAAAAGSSDPCVPAPAHPYFNVGLDPTDVSSTLTMSKSSVSYVRVEPYAFGDVGLIKWALGTDPGDPGIHISPEFGEGHAGDTNAMTITVDPNVKTGTYPLLIVSEAQAGGINEWFGSLVVK